MQAYQEYTGGIHSPGSGRYELIRHLADGGFGQVYLARLRGAAGFHRIVAIKRIHRDYTTSPEFVDDFIKEARIGGYLQHHNVVQVLGFEELDGHYSLIMEYVEGLGLDKILSLTRHHGAELAPGTVAEIGIQAAEGLQYIHTLRNADGLPLLLVHRDLKPSNLMVSRTGMVKITDFGVARTTLAIGRATQAGYIKGTVAYMSPEQARGEPLDHRSDLYSLGALLFQLLTLEPLFQGGSPFATLGQLSRNEVGEKLSELENTRARVFLPLLRALLTHRPDNRVSSAAQVASALRALHRALDPTPPLSTLAEQWLECVGMEAPQDPPPTAEDVPCDRDYEKGSLAATCPDLPFYVDAFDVDEPASLPRRSQLEPASAPGPQEASAHPASPAAQARLVHSPPPGTGQTPGRQTSHAFLALTVAAHSSRRSYTSWALALASTVLLVAWLATPDAPERLRSAPVATRSSALPTQSTEDVDRGLLPVGAVPASAASARHALPSAEPERSRIDVPTGPTALHRIGGITVTSNPAASVMLDGMKVGTTPVARASVHPGTHQLRLSWPSLRMEQTFPVKVPAGVTVRIDCRAQGCEVR